MLVNAVIVIATVLAMELVAAAIHRYVMHGPGWGWHRSHHEPHSGLLERNDLYAVVFAGLAMVLILWTGPSGGPLYWIGIGMSVYGALYFVVHDGLVHQRWPFRHVPKNSYLKRLVQAHRLHHAVEGREGCVSFGFLYAPPVKRLRDELRGRDGALGPMREKVKS
jgi:beta-carotene 3-hydroxylase